jgi:hypothetical protein
MPKRDQLRGRRLVTHALDRDMEALVSSEHRSRADVDALRTQQLAREPTVAHKVRAPRVPVEPARCQSLSVAPGREGQGSCDLLAE